MVEKSTKYQVRSTKYGLEFFPRLANCLPVGRQDTSYLIFFNVEVGKSTMYQVRSTKYGLEFFSRLANCLPVGRQDTSD
jgi:hypothetical protein